MKILERKLLQAKGSRFSKTQRPDIWDCCCRNNCERSASALVSHRSESANCFKLEKRHGPAGKLERVVLLAAQMSFSRPSMMEFFQLTIWRRFPPGSHIRK